MFYDSYLLTFLRKNMHTHIFIREDQISRLGKDMPTLGYLPPGGKIASPGVRYPGGHVQGKITLVWLLWLQLLYLTVSDDHVSRQIAITSGNLWEYHIINLRHVTCVNAAVYTGI